MSRALAGLFPAAPESSWSWMKHSGLKHHARTYLMALQCAVSQQFCPIHGGYKQRQVADWLNFWKHMRPKCVDRNKYDSCVPVPGSEMSHSEQTLTSVHCWTHTHTCTCATCQSIFHQPQVLRVQCSWDSGQPTLLPCRGRLLSCSWLWCSVLCSLDPFCPSGVSLLLTWLTVGRTAPKFLVLLFMVIVQPFLNAAVFSCFSVLALNNNLYLQFKHSSVRYTN